MTPNPFDRFVVFACDFRPRVVNGVSVMPNHGRAAGAPAWLTLGDGTTSSTFPTPLAKGFGATFDGGDYVNTGVVDRYGSANKFSLYFFGYASAPKTFPVRTYISSSTDGTGTFSNGIFFGQGNVVFCGVMASVSSRAVIYTTPAQRLLASSTMTYDGAKSYLGVSHYANGILATRNLLYNNLSSGTIKNGSPFILGANAGLSEKLTGGAYAFGIADGLLTPRDINLIDATVRGMI